MYDWANSAFATTILAAVLPIYFSKVAGATLPSAARATAIWSTGLSLSLAIIAVLSPILGTISDVMRGKKRFLAAFTGLGILSTALLVGVERGDWVLASILAILGRIGFNGSLTFYDALLPHVARPEDQDAVSARGYAMGYLGGGLLLAINVVMIQFLPGTWGARLSFLSVAIWWAVFTLPILLTVPEPLTASAKLKPGEGIVSASFKRLGETLRDIRHYRQLFEYLLAFLLYNDGIGTIIGVAAIYGTELGMGSTELILALLLVQFVGIPYSLIFGRLPNTADRRRPIYLAFILFNVIALPLTGIVGAQVLPGDFIGGMPARFETTAAAYGEGSYSPTDGTLQAANTQNTITVPAAQLGAEQDALYVQTPDVDARFEFSFNGEQVSLLYSLGPDGGIWAVELDGQPLLGEDGQPMQIDSYSPTVRYDEATTILAPAAGQHTLSLVVLPQSNPQSSGHLLSVGQLMVLPAARKSNLGAIIAMILLVEAVGLAFAFLTGRRFFSGLATQMNTKNGILLSLGIYAMIAVWGYILNSVIEFWFLAWMVAVVQGGSQALSRSLYAAMSPASKSGEFFGLFSVMDKFSSLIGPLMFAAAGFYFGSSRPAVLSLILLFVLGGWLLTRVDVEAGKRVAQSESAG